MVAVDIYTKEYCPYCVRAKALLTQKQVSFREIKIDENPGLRPEMIERSKGGTTVPQIFINDAHVGGCDDLMALEASNNLDSLLKA
ncbi:MULTISPECIES: glutaredoxin 3 [Thalassomonas]|uniref:Glutaredoxin n=1 Tax=Thalassomonas actiniarum TaxID=485447 RepID=A0AAE9YSI7_9GAMM|nr:MULTISPECIES: glutaredoxin 3 [Thalassomonas]WDD99498.1 glutaredoxin 3 [Thalassomonas actiniarum]